MSIIKVFTIFLLVLPSLSFAEDNVTGFDTKRLYKSRDFALGVGVSLVKFDTNLKTTSKTGGRSVFLDIEGNLNLPEVATVYSFYGAYRFNSNHSILMNYFSVKRSSKALSIDETFGDTVTINANIDVQDRSKFFNLSYGYNLFRNKASTVTLIAGLNAMNLAYKIDIKGSLKVDGKLVSEGRLFDENLFVPLPLIGLNFRYNYSKDFAVSTNVSFVAGAYKNVTAGILQSSFNTMYNITDYFGLLLGITYFDADIRIEDEKLEHKIIYGYKGVTAGLYFAF